MMNRLTTTILATLTLFSSHAAADPPAAATTEVAGSSQATANWHQNPECQAVFFTVLEGLYRDGISAEIVDTVIGTVEDNQLKKSFIFRCQLCHACYEAFALYQRRPTFHGTDGKNTIGKREVPQQIVDDLKSGNIMKFNDAFATIVQPWIKADLRERLARGEDGLELMKKYVKLAEEGNRIRQSYLRCQACDAIGSIAEAMGQQKTKEDRKTAEPEAK